MCKNVKRSVSSDINGLILQSYIILEVHKEWNKCVYICMFSRRKLFTVNHIFFEIKLEVINSLRVYWIYGK